MTSSLRVFGASVAALALVGAVAWGQEEKKEPPPKPPMIKIEKVRIGFQPYDALGRAINKPGMWAPALVTVKAGEQQLKKVKLTLETNDNEDVGQIVTQEFALEPNERRTVQLNVRPGNKSADVKVLVEAENRTFDANLPSSTLDLNAQIILTLGNRLDDLNTALGQLQGGAVNQGFNQPFVEDGQTTRFAAFETDVNLLPEHWTGYHGVDVMILSTDRGEFVRDLSAKAHRERLAAIAQWVRRGGHLVVSVNWNNQGDVAQMFKEPAWMPPVPVLIPDNNLAEGDALAVTHLPQVQKWARGAQKQFLGQEKGKDNRKVIRLAQLKPRDVVSPDWEVLARTEEDDGSRPVIARMAYGRGSITLMAFSFQQSMSAWEGRFDFWKELVRSLAPKTSRAQQQRNNFGDQGNVDDLSATFYTQLDNFDVKVVPFGWVALFILLYILVVGPLDYFLLKYVFQRLEWTWITFPTVVFAVSIAAYFTAYAIKGKDLKINQVDIVDFDLRTHLDEKGQTKRAYVYGQTFFALLSPRIQNYTIGLDPNPAFWGQTGEKKNVSTDMLSWLGPAADRFNGMGRRGSQSYFRRPYQYSRDPVGVERVPITVWGTKAFMASWEAALPQVPFKADLYYDQVDRIVVKIWGKLENNLPVDLEDVWLFYRDNAYSLGKTLPAKNGAIELKGALGPAVQAQTWVTYQDDADKHGRPTSDKGAYNPTPQIKQLLVHEKADSGDNLRNHSFRNLDMTWRMQPENAAQKDTGTREAILYARVRFRSGEAEALTADDANPLPTHLWLGTLPSATEKRPALSGVLNQDTYIRVILPVRPGAK